MTITPRNKYVGISKIVADFRDCEYTGDIIAVSPDRLIAEVHIEGDFYDVLPINCKPDDLKYIKTVLEAYIVLIGARIRAEAPPPPTTFRCDMCCKTFPASEGYNARGGEKCGPCFEIHNRCSD